MMKIGYLLSPGTIVSGRSNGIRQQAISWKIELERRGHVVDLLEPCGDYDWSTYSLIHVFQGGDWLRNVVPPLRGRVRRLVFSPIIDSNQPPFLYRIAAGLQIKPLRLRTENVITRDAALLSDLVISRSNHESAMIEVGLGVPRGRIRKVMIGFRTLGSVAKTNRDRLSVCLHVSSFTQKRKNVERLIDAARLAGVELWIAGNPGNKDEFERLRLRASGHAVKFLGFQSDQALVGLMSKAKAFALPSLNEGVGLAALEAGALGCEIVVTKLGGPPDYFGRLAHFVDPLCIRDIAQKLELAMHGDPFQPLLSEHLSRTCSAEISGLELDRIYSSLL